MSITTTKHTITVGSGGPKQRTRSEKAHELLHNPSDAPLTPLHTFCAVMIGQDVLTKTQRQLLSELALWDEALEIDCALFSGGVVYVSITGRTWHHDGARFTIGKRGGIDGQLDCGTIRLGSWREVRACYVWAGGTAEVVPALGKAYGAKA